MPIEQVIQRAISEYNDGKFASIRAAAAFYEISPSTLSRRLRGQKCRPNEATNRQYLHPIGEGVVVSWIKDLRRQYVAVTISMIEDLAWKIAKKPRRPGRGWLAGFYKRHPELKSCKGRVLPSCRLIAIDSDIVRMVFQELERLVHHFDIQKEDIYNMDEVGFQMGQRANSTIVCDRYSGPPLIARSETSQWTSVIETIACDGFALAPYIIHSGVDPVSGWFPPSELQHMFHDWLWDYSPKGWTTDEIAVRWLTESFIPQAHRRRKGRNILLILDSHGSHCTGDFIANCHDNDIKLIWLPPHSSHILQPLDLEPYAQLKRIYSRQIVNYTPTGAANINRRQFDILYHESRRLALQRRYILAGWKLAGIEPRDMQRVLDNPIIKAIDRDTPDMTLPDRDVWSSPTQNLPRTPTQDHSDNQERLSLEEIQSFIREGQAHATPKTARAIRYMGRFLIEQDANLQRLGTEFKLLYKGRAAIARSSRRKKYMMDQRKRAYNFGDVMQQREEAGEVDYIELDQE